METGATPARIMELGMGFMASRTVLSAVELGVFATLAGGALDLEALRDRLGLHPRAARDFLDSLVALGLLTRDAAGRYANGADADAFLDPAKPAYLGGLLEMVSARLYGFWGSLTEALRTGRQQNESKTGGDIFDAIYRDPALLEGFTRAMTGLSRLAANALVGAFDWSRVGSVIDIGCAQGCVPVALAQAHPHLTGGGFDLPPVAPVFARFVGQAGLADRLRFIAGDFFKDPLPRADVLVMGHVLHDWDLPTKRMLLGKAHAALAPGGTLIVYENLIDDDRGRAVPGFMMSLNMLIETAGGFDFSAADCIGWMREAGFREARVAPLDGPRGAVIATA